MLAYETLVRGSEEYASEVRDPRQGSLTDQLSKNPKVSARFVYFVYTHNTLVTKLKNQANIESLFFISFPFL